MITIIICNIRIAEARLSKLATEGEEVRMGRKSRAHAVGAVCGWVYSSSTSVSPICAAAMSSSQNGKRTQRLAEYSRVWSP